MMNAVVLEDAPYDGELYEKNREGLIKLVNRT